MQQKAMFIFQLVTIAETRHCLPNSGTYMHSHLQNLLYKPFANILLSHSLFFVIFSCLDDKLLLVR